MNAEKIENIKEGKEVSFCKGYFIYKDGRCYSEKTNRFLSKRKTASKSKTSSKYYYSYELSPYGTCLISRLVMFFYGKHNFEDIKDMPKVIHVDGNPENLHINNLKFATQSEINLINDIRFPASVYDDKASIKKENKKIIENLLKKNLTYKNISEIFETSEMSVYRFVKKHIKNQSPMKA